MCGTTYTTIDVPWVSEPTTYAYGIDGNNIAGYYYDSSGNFTHGFLYDGTTYTTLDVDVPEALGTYLYGIDGDNIVGRYSYGDFNSQSFIATIPEPSTAALFALGLAGCALVRRRSRSIS